MTSHLVLPIKVTYIFSAIILLGLMPIPSLADSTKVVDDRLTPEGIKEFMELHGSEFVFDTTGPEPTVSVLLNEPYDTTFLDTVGQFIGPKTPQFPGSWVGFDIPIRKIGLLKDIRWTYSSRVYIPERWERYWPVLGPLVIEPCPLLEEWPPITISIHSTESRNTGRKQVINRVDSETPYTIRITNVGHARVEVDSLPAGIYSCVLERDSTLPWPGSIDSSAFDISECTKITIDGILVHPGHNTILDLCIVFGLKAYEDIKKTPDPCNLIYYAELKERAD